MAKSTRNKAAKLVKAMPVVTPGEAALNRAVEVATSTGWDLCVLVAVDGGSGAGSEVVETALAQGLVDCYSIIETAIVLDDGNLLTAMEIEVAAVDLERTLDALDATARKLYGNGARLLLRIRVDMVTLIYS